MKHLIFIFFFIISVHAHNLSWYGSYETAHKEALKKHKMLMVLLVEKDCPNCNKILSTTFMNQPYLNKVDDLFVSVLITKGQKETYPIEMLYTMTYPSVFFLDAQELFVGENIFGYIDSETFEKHLNLYF